MALYILIPDYYSLLMERQVEYLLHDKKAGTMFNMIENELGDDQLKFIAILSHLHTNALDLTLLEGCLRDDISFVGLP